MSSAKSDGALALHREAMRLARLASESDAPDDVALMQEASLTELRALELWDSEAGADNPTSGMLRKSAVALAVRAGSFQLARELAKPEALALIVGDARAQIEWLLERATETEETIASRRRIVEEIRRRVDLNRTAIEFGREIIPLLAAEEGESVERRAETLAITLHSVAEMFFDGEDPFPGSGIPELSNDLAPDDTEASLNDLMREIDEEVEATSSGEGGASPKPGDSDG